MNVIEAVAILFEKCLNTVPNKLSRTFPQASIMGMTSSAMAGVLLGNKNGSGLADDIAYFIVTLVEFTSNKEIMHLTMFSMFILCANFQLSIGAYGEIIVKENSAKIFMLSMFTLSAAFLELADLGLDQVLKQLEAASLSQYYLALNGVESIISIIAVLIFCYSVDRFMAFLKLKTLELKNVVH